MRVEDLRSKSMSWKIYIETTSDDCPYVNDCKARPCARFNCPLFQKTLTWDPNVICGCGYRGSYRYDGVYRCPDCLFWMLKREDENVKKINPSG